jgi:CheY-like chemotaxis protein
MPFSYRILFVDDEERLRNMAKAILEAQGYEVHCAKDGFAGLVALKESLPDLIISDLQMPNMNGFEFLSVVRQRFPHLPDQRRIQWRRCPQQRFGRCLL